MEQGNPSYALVEKRADLKRLAHDLKAELAIGVDLEADSMFHYKEKVCLIQISTRFQNFIVDPLTLKNLSPLLPIFKDPRIQKIFHGADYDIRSLHRDFGIQVHSLFDTQIAARFLGLKETGLANLLQDRLGISIKKKYQKKDWSKRPLPSAMLSYAVEDACHLITLAQDLKEELLIKGRLFCVEEECGILSMVRHENSQDGNPLFMRFKGARRFDPLSLAVLEAILQYRDRLARRRNLPPFKVIGNVTIKEIVERKPLTVNQLKHIKGMTPAQIERVGRSLLQRIQKAHDMPEKRLPVYPSKSSKPLGHRVAKRVRVLKEWREKRASALDLDPAILCANARIQALAIANPKAPRDLEGIDGMRKWQRQVFGRELCALLKDLAWCVHPVVA